MKWRDAWPLTTLVKMCVQNLQKKHQTMQAETLGHEPLIKTVTQKGEIMVEKSHRGRGRGNKITRER